MTQARDARAGRRWSRRIALGLGGLGAIGVALAAGGLERLVPHVPRASGLVHSRVVAHRGFSAEAPENTLAAFRRAAALGAMIELDVTLAKTGEVVCIHDDDLDRTTDGTGPVAEASLETLRSLDAGRWFSAAFEGEPIPTLDEVLAAIDGEVVVDIELKTTDDKAALARAVVDAVQRAGQLDRVFVSSFDPLLLEQVRLAEPAIPRGQLVGTFEGSDVVWYERFLLQNLALNGRARPDLVIAGDDFVSRGWVERQKRRGYPVMVFTVNEPERMRELVSWGVDAVITDRPDLAVRTIGG